MMIAIQGDVEGSGMRQHCAYLLGTQVPFLLLWCAESATKVFAYGVWLTGWNAFDALVTLAGVVCFPIVAAAGCSSDSALLLRALMLLRLVRLLRLLAPARPNRDVREHALRGPPALGRLST